MSATPAIADDLPQRAREAVLRLVPDAEAIYLFGSRVDGRARDDSDLDLAVLDAAPMQPLRRFEMQRELSALLDHDVDLVDLFAASTVLRLEVVARGKLLYRRDADHTLDFEARVLGEYAELMDATRDLRDRARARAGLRAMSPLILGKVAAIERSVARAREEFAAAGAGFGGDFTRQDAAILNILRGCELALDLANVVVRDRGLGIPQSGRDGFRLLAEANLIEAALSDRLQRMVGFRNIAVHQYQKLEVAVVESILRRDLDDLLAFAQTVARLA